MTRTLEGEKEKKILDWLVLEERARESNKANSGACSWLGKQVTFKTKSSEMSCEEKGWCIVYSKVCVLNWNRVESQEELDN